MTRIEERIIIALDQDNFYCGVERVLNPSLCGKPIGISQKSLLATTSYEARARGVTKLMSISKALELVPDLVLVSGEDLTNYRTFSREVTRVVEALVGGGEREGRKMDRGVEKLGMDEVFVDVTDMIDGHIESTPLPSNPSLSASSSNLVLFPLPPCAWPLLPSDSTGFYYNPQIISGHILQPSSSRSPSLFPLSIIIQNLHLRRTIIATHLASFIRDKIKEKIGLTSSAGVGRNKLLAKLLAGVRKPDGQTCFAPFEAEGVEGVSEEGMIQSFLDGLSIKKIPGFGHKVVQSIDEALTRKGVVMPDTGSWTVHQVRTHLTAKELELLSPSRGTKLYSLLHGKDPDPVKPNGSFPLQIGVEDSFAKQGRCRLGFWMDRLKELVEALLRRLEGELMMPLVPSKGDEGGWLSVLPHKQNLKQDGGKKRWERYPHSIRLLLRFLPSPTNPNQRTTLSKSMSLAAFLLNHERAVQDRAEEWMRKSGEGLFRELLGAKKGEELGLYEVYVINITVTDLTKFPPPPSVLNNWANQTTKSSKKRKRALDDIKGKTGSSATQAIEVDELDEFEIIEVKPSRNIQRRTHEHKKVYKIDEENLPNEIVQKSNEKDTTTYDDYNDLDNHDETNDNESGPDDTYEEGDEINSQALVCTICGADVFAFAKDAHERWHQSD